MDPRFRGDDSDIGVVAIPLGLREMKDTLTIFIAHQPPTIHQIIQMGDGLAHGEYDLVSI